MNLFLIGLVILTLGLLMNILVHSPRCPSCEQKIKQLDRNIDEEKRLETIRCPHCKTIIEEFDTTFL